MSPLMDLDNANISSSAKAETDLPPAALLFAPDDPNLFVVGTYFLEPEDAGEGAEVSETPLKQEKRGELCLYEPPTILNGNRIRKLCSVSVPAVYDFKFVPGDRWLIIAVHPEGTVSVINGPNHYSLEIIAQQILVEEDGVSILSLNFHPKDASKVAMSLSTGEIIICSWDRRTLQFAIEETIQCHSLEAWTVDFSENGELLFSGGDDSVFAVSSVETRQKLWENRKIHGAGVTAVLEYTDSLVFTGSYDEYLRLIDITTRRQINEIHLGGGVWRLHWIDRAAGTILASCMHIGTKIVRVGKGGEDLEVLASFGENKSMNYASHVHPDKRGRIMSSSFYDKTLFMWNAGPF